MLDKNAHTFERHRATLEGVAYRMLGSLAEASDIVQDTYLKWRDIDESRIENPRAWLITTCSRLAINELGSARVKRESYYGLWLPEPYIEDTNSDSSYQLEVDESVSIALMMTLEKLSPLERAGFILREVFGLEFEEVARVLGKSNDSCRKLVSRARKNIKSRSARFEATSHEHKQLLEGFFVAAQGGDLEAFNQLLTTSVELYADGGGKAKAISRIISGPDVIGRFFSNIWGDYKKNNVNVVISSIWYNGCPGMLIYEDDCLATAISIDVKDNKIDKIYAIRNPDKLNAFT